MSDETRRYLTGGSHVLISGATGAGEQYGGKSVLANWWLERSVATGWHDMGVFYNPKGLGYVRGAIVRDLEDLAREYRSGTRLFDFRPPSTYGADEHTPVVEMLRKLPGSKIVAHDECQAYEGSDGLAWAMAQGGNMDNSADPTDSIRSLLVTQRPWNLPEELRANAPIKVWVGPATTEGARFFRSEQMQHAWDDVEANAGAYRWAVTDAGEYVTTVDPVPEDYAE